MLNYYHIKNFKSLKNVDITPTNLNLMLGLNSMGKSSVIQSLLLLRQSYYRHNNLNRLRLNDSLVELGTSKDVFFQDAAEDEKIEYELNFDNRKSVFNYEYQNGLEYFNASDLKIDSLFGESLFTEGFHYLQADHISPSLTYKKADLSLQEINILGNMGEYAPTYLCLHSKDKLSIPAFHHEKARSNSLITELDAWMSVISPGVRVIAEEIPGNQIKMGFKFESKNGVSEQFSPINVGFGLSYVRPLILTFLISKPGDIIIIENPESHLHPRGQSELGKLLAIAAQNGVQVFCETHSDHIINGIRLSVHDKILDNKKVKIFFFEKKEGLMLETMVTTVHIDSNGELDKYPNGLLDEWGNVLSQLF